MDVELDMFVKPTIYVSVDKVSMLSATELYGLVASRIGGTEVREPTEEELIEYKKDEL